ncbi:hypothetical protein IAG41_20535 [Sphingomonas sp. JC676]|uniref:hypothetical protein n=1 Tax=Sphingomonas sp. JC676 TaxID=2768065 RepID=UPI0016582108|nr:hypothetical protein [Sphingomonas sp. JC676]MBC9034785.1 hypothetical protein [Sphingomonas sp. JC676]
MVPLLLPALLLTAPVQRDHPVTYLASVSIPLGPDERISAFAFDTWGVQFKAVCRIPPGWRIKAGSSATPNGTFEGEASHGVTWIGRERMRELDALVLVVLVAPVQRHEIRDATGVIPATFAGKAVIETTDDQREPRIGADNIKLRRATRCP